MATLNEIREREAKEAERSNRANEDLKVKDRQARVGDTIARTAGTLLSIAGQPLAGAMVSKAGAIAKGIQDRKTQAFANSLGNKRDNDSSWYKRYELLVRNAAKIPFFVYKDKYLINEGKTKINTPGVSVIGFLPNIPKKTVTSNTQPIGNNSVLKRVSADYMSAVYQYIKVDRNYDAEDVERYIITLDNILSFIAATTKLLQSIKACDNANSYYGKMLLAIVSKKYNMNTASMKKFIEAVPEIEAALNDLILSVNLLFIPDIPLFRRHMWLNSVFVADDVTNFSEAYLFEQQSFVFPSFTSTASTIYWGEGAVTPTLTIGSDIYGQPCEMNDEVFNQADGNLTTTLNSLTACLNANRQSMAWISADLAALYAKGNSADNNLRLYFEPLQVKAVYYEQLDPLTPHYSLEVLEQIHNITLTGEPQGMNRGSVPSGYTQQLNGWWYDTTLGTYAYGWLDESNADPTVAIRHFYNYLFASASATYLNGLYLDPLYLDAIQNLEPTEDDILVMSRGTSTVHYINGSTQASGYGGPLANCGVVMSAGTEIFTALYLVQAKDFTDATNDSGIQCGTTTVPGFAAHSGTSVYIRNTMARFDNHPVIHIYDNSAWDVFADITNPAIITTPNLNNLHYGCGYSCMGLINNNPINAPTTKVFSYGDNSKIGRKDKSKGGKKKPAVGSGDGNPTV